MFPICSAVVLVKTPPEDMPTIVETWPTNFLWKDLELNSFKSSVKIPNRSSATFIFLFNISEYACISLNFRYNTIFYSLVIMTKYPFYHFYKQLFRIANQSFINDEAVCTPINRFYYIVTAVSSLPSDINFSYNLNNSFSTPPKLTVTFPTTEFEYTFKPNAYTYKDFNPTKYFTVNDCQIIWRALFMHQPVLILTKDPLAGSSAVLAAASLLAPLQFKDEICLWLNDSDPRFISVVNGESNLMIAATSSSSLAVATKHFSHVLKLSSKRFALNQAMTDKLFTKMKRTLMFTNYELDSLINDKDPYYDLVEGKLTSGQFVQSLKNYTEFDLPTVEEFEAWETTNSFKDWRSNRNIGRNFRDGVLNVDPFVIFHEKSKTDIQKIYNKLDSLIKMYSNDMHVVAVLKKHQKLARGILQTNKRTDE